MTKKSNKFHNGKDEVEIAIETATKIVNLPPMQCPSLGVDIET